MHACMNIMKLYIYKQNKQLVDRSLALHADAVVVDDRSKSKMRTVRRGDVVVQQGGGAAGGGRTGDEDMPPPNHAKTSWPELVGWDEMPAALRILNDRPEVRVVFYFIGQLPSIPVHEPDRVLAFVDANDRIVVTPLLI